MTQKRRLTAVAGLLVGLLAQRGPLAASAADGIGSGPAAAIEKARAAATAGAARAITSNAAAEQAFGNPAEQPATPPADAPGAPASPEAAAAPDQAGNAGEVAAAGAPSKYDPSKHRDPFRPPTLATAAAESGPRTPLEGYEIGQLTLVGIIGNAQNTRALVEDSAGLGYIITAGTAIGSSGGVVRSIEPGRVRIEETVTNFYGQREPRERVLELPQEDRSP